MPNTVIIFSGRARRITILENIGRRCDVSEFKEGDIPEEFRKQFEESIRDSVCPHCNAYLWKRERRGLCCSDGGVKLPQLPPPPDELLPLYTARGSHFLKNVRAYNNIFALASLGCSEIRQPGFNPTFTIQGKMYHRIGALLPNENEMPKFAQLYFHDTENELENRIRIMDGLNEDVVETIQETLHRVNPYISSLKSGIDLMTSCPEVKLVLHANKNDRPTDDHARSYNLPTARY